MGVLIYTPTAQCVCTETGNINLLTPLPTLFIVCIETRVLIKFTHHRPLDAPCVCVHGDGDVGLHPTAHSLFSASAQRPLCQLTGLHAHSPSNLVTKVLCASVSLCSSMGLRKSCHVTAERAFRHDDIVLWREKEKGRTGIIMCAAYWLFELSHRLRLLNCCYGSTI